MKELLVLDRNTWNNITVCKQMSSNHSFKNDVTYKLFTSKSYVWKQSLALNKPIGLICYKRSTNQTTSYILKVLPESVG